MDLEIIRKKLNNKIKNKKGSTMVEVIVAFTILLLMLASFQGCVKVSMNLWNRGIDIIHAEENFNAVYTSKNRPAGTKLASSITLTNPTMGTIELKNVSLVEYSTQLDEMRMYRFE